MLSALTAEFASVERLTLALKCQTKREVSWVFAVLAEMSQDKEGLGPAVLAVHTGEW